MRAQYGSESTAGGPLRQVLGEANGLYFTTADGLAGGAGVDTPSVLLTSRSLVAGGDNTIAHGLAAAPSSWSMEAPSTSAFVWQSSAADATNLHLHCDVDVTCNLRCWL